jgi:hypothetical protein
MTTFEYLDRLCEMYDRSPSKSNYDNLVRGMRNTPMSDQARRETAAMFAAHAWATGGMKSSLIDDQLAVVLDAGLVS